MRVQERRQLGKAVALPGNNAALREAFLRDTQLWEAETECDVKSFRTRRWVKNDISPPLSSSRGQAQAQHLLCDGQHFLKEPGSFSLEERQNRTEEHS